MTSESSHNSTCTIHLDAENPWPGLAAYDETAKDFFYGRSAEASELLRLIHLAPLTVLYGKSGLGKSSLLQAGLFPLLRVNHYLPVYLRLDFSPGAKASPLEQAAHRLSEEIALVGAECPEQICGEGLWEYLHRKDVEIWSSDNFLLTPVLVFDQFEELLSHGGDAERIGQVFDNLADLIENRITGELASDAEKPRAGLDLFSQHYRIIFSFREDYLPEVKSWEKKMPSLLQNCQWLKPMTRQRAVEAIQEAGKEVLDEGVAPLIADFVGGIPNRVIETDAVIEPVLISLFCSQLNLRRYGGKIDKMLVENSGKDILTNFYGQALEDEDVKGLPDVSIFIEDFLVQGERFRGAYPKVEALKENQLTERQLDALTTRRRLLRIVQHEDTPRIELIHDCLVPVVRKARDERKARTHQAELEQNIKEANARIKEKKKNNRRLIKWRRGLLGAVIFSLIALIIAIKLIVIAKEDELSVMAAAATSSSYSTLGSDPELSTLMGLQAVSLAKSAKDRTTLSRAENPLRRAINTRLQLNIIHKQKVRTVSFSSNGEQLATGDEDGLHLTNAHNGWDITPEPWKISGAINKIVFTKDGSRLLSGGGDNSGSVRVWDTSTGEDKTPKPMSHGAPISALALGSGNFLATGNLMDGRVVLWNIASGDQIGTLPTATGDKSWIADLAFNADGSRLAVCEVDIGATTVWNADKLPNIRAMSPNITLTNWKLSKDGIPDPMLVDSIAFSSNGQQLVTGDRFNTANLWDTKTGAHQKTFYGHTDSVRKVAFSPDGSRLATASTDGTANIWDLATDRMLFSLAQKSQIKDLAFSSDGNRLVTASDDKTVKIWNVAAHADAVSAVAFSPDSKHFATGSGDTTIKIWETGSRRLIATLAGHTKGIQRLVFSPHDNFLASASLDHSARIWDLSTGKEVQSPFKYQEPKHGFDKVYDVAYSPDGKLLATAGANFNAVVWDVATHKILFKGKHANQVSAVAFSPDERQLLASVSKDGVLNIWKIPSDNPIFKYDDPEPDPHKRHFLDVNFSPDGKRLVIAAGTNSILLMDMTTEKVNELPSNEPRQVVTTAQFTPDGKNILTTGQNFEVMLWDAQTGAAVKSMWIHNKKINDVAVSPDGKWIATASQDMTFNVSPLNTDELLAIGCGQVTRDLTPDECKRFLGNAQCPLPRPCDQLNP